MQKLSQVGVWLEKNALTRNSAWMQRQAFPCRQTPLTKTRHKSVQN